MSLSGLLERLNLSRDEGEKWIVNLIWETRMGADAKIDLEKVHSSSPFSFRRGVNMGLTPQNAIETMRSTVRLKLSINLSSKRDMGSPSAHRQSELPLLMLEDP